MTTSRKEKGNPWVSLFEEPIDTGKPPGLAK
jgi:hypothetical protein